MPAFNPPHKFYDYITSSGGIQWSLSDAHGELSPDDELDRTTRVYLNGFTSKSPAGQMFWIDEVMPEGWNPKEDSWDSAESYIWGLDREGDATLLGKAGTLDAAISAVDAYVEAH